MMKDAGLRCIAKSRKSTTANPSATRPYHRSQLSSNVRSEPIGLGRSVVGAGRGGSVGTAWAEARTPLVGRWSHRACPAQHLYTPTGYRPAPGPAVAETLEPENGYRGAPSGGVAAGGRRCPVPCSNA